MMRTMHKGWPTIAGITILLVLCGALLLCGCGAGQESAEDAAGDNSAAVQTESQSVAKDEAEADNGEAAADGAADTGDGTADDYANAEVSYLGPEGTYTQEACETFFRDQGTYLPYETVDKAIHALVKGESDYAVIPQENAIGGTVIDYLDALIAQPEVSVAGEVDLPISQNLLVLPNAKLGDIETVYSHKQGIAQGKEWLKENLPDAEVVEVSSTAEGAKMVAEGGDGSCAAIASAGCAEVYHLKLLEKNIQKNDKNKTRFYVLSMEEPATDPSDRLAFIAEGSAEGLPDLMSDMEEENMTLVTIHDRPRKTELGQYEYLIECSGSSYDSYRKVSGDSTFDCRYLGSFAVR